jgi:hypothetical protein
MCSVRNISQHTPHTAHMHTRTQWHTLPTSRRQSAAESTCSDQSPLENCQSLRCAARVAMQNEVDRHTCARIADETFVVELLGEFHCVVGRHAQFVRRQLLQRHCSEWQRTPLALRLRFNLRERERARARERERYIQSNQTETDTHMPDDSSNSTRLQSRHSTMRREHVRCSASRTVGRVRDRRSHRTCVCATS